MRRIQIQLFVTVTVLLMAGCQHAVYMMPTPAAITSGDLDPFTNTPEEEQDSNIVVGYVTNRGPVGAKEQRLYTRNFDQDLRIGNATVRIGDGEKTWNEIRELSREVTRKDQVLLSMESVEELATHKADESLDILSPEMTQIMEDLNKYIEKSPLNDVTVYVHGANNNFYRSAAQAAQYRHFTGRQAIVILYSWPSAENIVRYGTDIRNIRKTVPTFVRFIRLLARHSTAQKINILAYSAGATLTTEALAILGDDTSNPDRQAYKDSLRLGAIYFAAPDTDFDDWVKQYRSYQDIVDTVTVTVNQNDSVLAIAQEDRRWKAYGGWEDNMQNVTTKSRLGRPDIDDISAAEADWLIEQTRTPKLDVIDIDPSAIPGLGKGDHDFWYSAPWVSTDALLDINLHASPADRGLAERRGEYGGQIWYFPEDYEQRVAEALIKLNQVYETLRNQ